MLQLSRPPEPTTDDFAAPVGAVDFDLPGIVRIRLLQATEEDVKAVKRQLGLDHSLLSGKPEIVIRFTDRIHSTERRDYVGDNDTARTNHDFLIIPHNRINRSIQIPFDQVGEQCELVCESGTSPIPLLVPIINLTALHKGFLPVHASACFHNGTGILTSGWTGGGKTGLLLSLMSDGARFVSDDVTYLSPDGTLMVGFHQTIHVKDSYLAQLPEFRSRVKRRELFRMHGARFLQSLGRSIPDFLSRPLCSPRMRNRLNRFLQGRRSVQMPPEKLFGTEACLDSCPLDKVVVTIGHNRENVSVQPASSEEVAEQLLATTVHEAQELKSYYLKYRFAFPDKRNELIEKFEQIQREMFLRMLADKETYLLRHPVPASLPQLYEALRPLYD